MGRLLLLHREQNFCQSITAATRSVSPVLDFFFFFYYVVFTNPSTSPLLLLEISTGSTHIGPQDLTSSVQPAVLVRLTLSIFIQ